MQVTYYVVQGFEEGRKGVLIPVEAKQAQSQRQAEQMAYRIASETAGAIAFSRTGDPETGEFEDAVILAQHGLIPGDLLEMAS